MDFDSEYDKPNFVCTKCGQLFREMPINHGTTSMSFSLGRDVKGRRISSGGVCKEI